MTDLATDNANRDEPFNPIRTPNSPNSNRQSPTALAISSSPVQAHLDPGASTSTPITTQTRVHGNDPVPPPHTPQSHLQIEEKVVLDWAAISIYFSAALNSLLFFFSSFVIGYGVYLFYKIPLPHYLYIGTAIIVLGLLLMYLSILGIFCITRSRITIYCFLAFTLLYLVGALLVTNWMSNTLRTYGITWDGSDYQKLRVETTFNCCGFENAMDQAIQPCPAGTINTPCEPLIDSFSNLLRQLIWIALWCVLGAEVFIVTATIAFLILFDRSSKEELFPHRYHVK